MQRRPHRSATTARWGALAAALTAAGCAGSDEIIAEARADLPAVTAALDAHFAEHGEFPERLDQLDVDESLIRIDADEPGGLNGAHSYEYEPRPATPGGTLRCRYTLRLREGNWAGEGADDTHLQYAGDRCDPAEVAAFDAEVAAAFAEAAVDFAVLEPALAEHFARHGTYPDRLDELDVPHGAAAPGDPRARYSYRPGRALDAPDGAGNCSYFLSVGWEAPLDTTPAEPAEIHRNDC